MGAIYGAGSWAARHRRLVAEADSASAWMESDRVTSKRKEKPLTCGPGLSAAEGRCAAGQRLTELGRRLAGPREAGHCGAQGRRQTGLWPKRGRERRPRKERSGPWVEAGLRAKTEEGEEILFFFF